MSPLVREARRLVLASQFLTRLPAPRLRSISEAELLASTHWFPLVGLVIGALMAAAGFAGSMLDPWLGALAVLTLGVWITGALHLDGLADVTDGLGAAHGRPERQLEAMRDPHIGSLGAVAMALLLAGKLVLLMLLLREGQWLALLLVPAWARLGTLYWAATVPPLATGMGERFAWRSRRLPMLAWLILLAPLSWWLSPWLLLAPGVMLAWAAFLRHRVGGMTGDGLGAGVELTEAALLLILVVGALW
ncbi:Cobalamin synthase [Thioalkalivibrio nitratireducens DSM 14787]|uniref:Adenosylcobinamide-GDP ribazoletransferase n=1 Tax=Thioalkalivibrio nitratireducens (strain DSM 14787 / UNIQEM 213 / ALEN2) TaxID=1255043 RepID=L0E1N5_THIND|nr:adenosylcobinamide-GDP ribazoletransferase [Thioalkalivibrio nitratireducens]AGA35120.1 Cobalamin synthase [Thioalkalivibrio nitratireducens DSM 14787]